MTAFYGFGPVSGLEYGVSPSVVAKVLSRAAKSWDREGAYWVVHLFRVTVRGDHPDPFYTCMRACDRAMSDSWPEYSGIREFEREEFDCEGMIPLIVADAIRLVRADARALEG